MKITKDQISSFNTKCGDDYIEYLGLLEKKLDKNGVRLDDVLEKINQFQVAIPSWALGAGGTRFGRFSYNGEPASLEHKIDDVGLLHALTGNAGAISLHIPWDIPRDIKAIKERAAGHNLIFDAVNSNTFQDQESAAQSYKYGSLSNDSPAVRDFAVEHNKKVIDIGKTLESKSLTVWLADGTNFPGQSNFQRKLQNTQDSLREIYGHLPADWKMFIEYKPFEPSFYSTVIQDWGTSLMLAEGCGERAYTLVDLGHHLPNTNIEQIVATLLYRGKLGGFHFNDSKYGDDDLTVGSIKPYALFLIFNELVYGMQHNLQNPDMAWMIDASHNTKDPLEDLLQSIEAILMAYCQALLVDQERLKTAQLDDDVVQCQEIMQEAFRTDVRPILKAARASIGAALRPLAAYRHFNVREKLVGERGANSRATGL